MLGFIEDERPTCESNGSGFLVEKKDARFYFAASVWMVNVLMSTAGKLLIRDVGSSYIINLDFTISLPVGRNSLRTLAS